MDALQIAAAATYILLATYGNQTEEIAATNKVACEKAAEALKTRSWLPVGRDQKPSKVWCVPGNRFAKGWDKIKGFND